MTVPPQPLSTSMATHILVPEIGWVQMVPGSLLLTEQPTFIDAITGLPRPVPGLWAQFTGAADGITYGFFAAPGQPWLQWQPPPPPPPP